MVAAEGDSKQFRPAQHGAAAVVDNAGIYRIFNLTPGRYALAITWASMATGGREAPIIGAYLYPTNTKPEVFTITSGSAVTGINFVLPAQSEYSVSGRVTGLPPKQTAAVALVLRDQPTLAAALLMTTPEGDFRFDHVAPGSYNIRASAPTRGYSGSGAILGENALFGQAPVDIAGQNIQGAEIALEPSHALKLTLQSTQECPAVPVSLTLNPLENWGAMVTKAVELKPSEEFAVKDLAPGRYLVHASKPAGACCAPQPAIVDARASGPVRMILQPPGAIEVRARTSDAVTLSSVDDANIPAQVLPPKGDPLYRFETLCPGRYRLQSGSMSAEVEVRRGARTQAVLEPREPKP
jgi:hypothetical protein